ALPAHGAVETETTIEYTADAWQALTPRLQQMDASWTVLGSYHSHPGHGVFLSATDRDTQSEVFSHEWQVALVVDPVKDKIGFFLGEKGTPCPNWYVV
ncbi:MAG TPA: Mov34/MPN/PAD-1 family protein, partial [Chthonomonadaceae bacterium]|nr:Mov34/MPN/PAD-1 family protein [Chthonomonadaceae bacterium]